MKKLRTLLIIALAFGSLQSLAQTRVLSNNKSLAIFNPALQNFDYNKLYVSSSVFVDPLSESNNYTTYLVNAEANLKDVLRFGGHSSSVETRLTKYDLHKIYGSYNFELEEGNYFSFGLELGYFTSLIKLDEFHKVFAPTKFEYAELSKSGFDFGFGMAFKSNGFTIGLALNNLNRPQIVPYPFPSIDTVSGGRVHKDTTFVYGEGYTVKAKVQTNLHLMYEWDGGEKVNLSHILHLADFDFAGIDFVSFQNFVKYNKKASLGVGVYYNGEVGYSASLGYLFFEKLGIEASTFLRDDLVYKDNGDGFIDNDDTYKSIGIKPAFEINLKLLL